MLTYFHRNDGELLQSNVPEGDVNLPGRCVWIDLLDPTKSEEELVERILAIEVPTRDEMQEIETSSRLYVEANALVMTLPVLTGTNNRPETAAITFILSDRRLVTVRYADPSSIQTFIRHAKHQPGLALSGEHVMLGLLEHIADRLADVLENTTAELEKLSHEIFCERTSSRQHPDFSRILIRIGRSGDVAARAKESLVNLSRQILFFSSHSRMKEELNSRIETILRDVNSIDEHARFISEKVSFALNASLGMLNIEQNNIIKIFSVAAVAFMPPTLIASIYGMNFHHMPELDWPFGYPCAIFLMVCSGILPLWHFKRQNWL